MNIIIIGPQGSGKTTQGKILAKCFDVPFLSTGEMFRDMMHGDSGLSKRIREAMLAGNLVSDADTKEALTKYLDDSRFSSGFVIDGYPRNLDQARSIPFQVDVVLHIDVPHDISVERLVKRGRHDDTEDIIRKRLDTYYKETIPVLEYWRSDGKVIDVDGSKSIEEISESAIALLKAYEQKKNS